MKKIPLGDGYLAELELDERIFIWHKTSKRIATQSEAVMVREIMRLRGVLERIAKQGPSYGPDGTWETWKHWSEIAREALEQR